MRKLESQRPVHSDLERLARLIPVALTVASAVLYAIAFPPLRIWPLAWMALAPWLVACTRVSPRRAGWLGLLWGVVASYGLGSWFPTMVATYLEGPVWIGWLGFAVVAVPLAGVYFALFSAWVSWLFPRRGLDPVLVGCGWCVAEFCRANGLVGNPWGLVAYSQVPVPVLLQTADFAGPYASSLVIGSVNAVLAGMFVRGLPPRRRARDHVVVASGCAMVLAYGVWCLSRDFVGPSLEATVLQGATNRAYSWRSEYRRLGLVEYLNTTRRAAGRGTDLVVWPEHAVNFYLQEPSYEREEIVAAVDGAAVDLVLGGARYPSRRSEGAADGTFNSVFVVGSGAVTDAYDKRVLLPIAEEPWLGFRDERVHYERGWRSSSFSAGGARLGALICFEVMYPALVRDVVAGGADLLVNLSNDLWFASDAASEHHLDFGVLRAIEQRRYLIRSSNMGPSAIIDPTGKVRRAGPVGAVRALDGTVKRLTTRSPYSRWGDAMAWIVVVITVARTELTRRRGRSRPR